MRYRIEYADGRCCNFANSRKMCIRDRFSPAASGKLARVLAQGASDSCYKAAREALSGVDNTGGAIGFHAGKGSGTVIGNQTFF